MSAPRGVNGSAPDPFCVQSPSTEPHPRPSRVISVTRGRAQTPLKSGLPLASLGIPGAGDADWPMAGDGASDRASTTAVAFAKRRTRILMCPPSGNPVSRSHASSLDSLEAEEAGGIALRHHVDLGLAEARSCEDSDRHLKRLGVVHSAGLAEVS